MFHGGQLKAAHEHFELSLALAPEYLMAHYHLGIINERLGEYEAAAREFERALEESSGDASSVCHLALLRDAQGDHEAAEDLRRRARGFAKSQTARVLSDSKILELVHRSTESTSAGGM